MLSKRRTVTSIAAALAAGALLVGCSPDTGGNGNGGGSGESLPWGSTKEEYIAAFADLDPISIVAQAPSSPESALGARDKALWDAIGEWSGGKIEIEAHYNLALATFNEIDDALRDGRIDSAGPLPTFEPQQYPVTNDIANAAVVVSSAPSIETMVLLALMNDLMYSAPEAIAEYEDNGLKPLIAHQAPGTTLMACTGPYTSLSTLAGRNLPSSNAGQTALFNAWGANPVSIQAIEAFEGLQRGVIDCNPSNPMTTQSIGVAEIAPYLVAATGASIHAGWGTMVFSTATWDSLPLLAQQLIFDLHINTYLPETVKVVWEATGDIADMAASNGGGFVLLESDANDLVGVVAEDILADIAASTALDGEALVDRARERNEFWVNAIEELGFEADVGYDELAEWSADHQDLSAWVDLMYSEIWESHRPGS